MDSTEEEQTTPTAPVKRKSNSLLLVIASLVITAGLIGGAVLLRNKAKPHAEPNTTKSFNVAELAKFDGKDNKECFVAVDGTVYKIEQGGLWQNGQHSTSEGQAMCGKDLTQAISKSPHGKSKLTALEKMGTLTK